MIMLDYFSVKGVIMKKRITRIILILCLLSLTACGKKAPQKTSNFETKINNFTQKLLDMGLYIDSIDTSVEGYEQNLLDYMDELLITFNNLKSFEEPEDYVYYDDIVNAACFFMDKANGYFHKALDGTFSLNYYEAAIRFYEEAFENIHYIGYMIDGYDVSEVVHSLDELEQQYNDNSVIE